MSSQKEKKSMKVTKREGSKKPRKLTSKEVLEESFALMEEYFSLDEILTVDLDQIKKTGEIETNNANLAAMLILGWFRPESVAEDGSLIYSITIPQIDLAVSKIECLKQEILEGTRDLTFDWD